MKLNTLTLAKTISLLKTKEVSHKELYDDVSAEIEKSNKSLNIFLALDKDAEKKAEELFFDTIKEVER